MLKTTSSRGIDDEVTALKKELAALKRAKIEASTLLHPPPNELMHNLGQSDGANPLLVCLIDGDGCIFNKSLLVLGTKGGRKAAFELRQHIIAHYGSNHDLLVNVFFNREGLGKSLKSHLGVQSDDFNAFITGFNTASPLMSMLDIGVGKDAADAKIRSEHRLQH
jgi:hypothetical protein